MLIIYGGSDTLVILKSLEQLVNDTVQKYLKYDRFFDAISKNYAEYSNLLKSNQFFSLSELSGNSTEETVNSTQFEISTLEPWKIDFSNTCTINSFDYEANGSFNFYESSADYEQVKKYTSQIGRLDVPDVYTSTIENGYSWIYDPADGVDSFVNS